MSPRTAPVALRRRVSAVALVAMTACLGLASSTFAQSTGGYGQATRDAEEAARVRRANSVTPTTKSIHDPADAILDRLLGSVPLAETRPSTTSATTAPSSREATTSPAGYVAPDVDSSRLLREGTYVIDRVGRVQRLDDGQLLFIFASDGVGPISAGDPPMRLVPNLNLMAVESAVRDAADRRFRVTGRVTEYRGQNHLILEKVIVLN